MSFKKKTKVNATIPTASMPDIIFMLLIFFMVATVFKQYSGLKVKVPAAAMIQKIPGSKRHVVTIWVNREGQVICDDVIVKKIADLRNVAYKKRLADPQIIIALKIDKNVKMDFVNKVHQELRKANTLKVNYNARPGEL
jgi:biopolymer transport protein ExbD